MATGRGSLVHETAGYPWCRDPLKTGSCGRPRDHDPKLMDAPGKIAALMPHSPRLVVGQTPKETISRRGPGPWIPRKQSIKVARLSWRTAKQCLLGSWLSWVQAFQGAIRALIARLHG